MSAIPPPSPLLLPWERRPDESGEAYAAFIIYRDCGPARSLDGSYRQSGKGRKTGASAPTRAPGTWRGWHKTYEWVSRARAWDARLDQARLGAREQVAAAYAASDQERQELQRKREETLLSKLYTKLEAMMEFGLVRTMSKGGVDGKEITIFEPVRWSFAEVISGVQVFAKLGRVHAQLPTTVLEGAGAASTVDELFVQSNGQLADRLPDGVTPPMPDNCAARPEIGATITGGNNGLIQPGKPPRPTEQQLMEERDKGRK